MQGCRVLIVSCILSLSACAGKSILKADCHSCTEAESEWSEFPVASLVGAWKGSVEIWKNSETEKKRQKEEKQSNLRFIPADQFFQSRGVSSCAGVPESSVVMNGIFWNRGAKPDTTSLEYETFGKGEEDAVAYGRISFVKINGQEICKYQRMGRVMGMNRLRLPTVSFTQPDVVLTDTRSPASSGEKKEYEIGVEFLRVDSATAKPVAFPGESRKPASIALVEKPPLMIRVYRMQNAIKDNSKRWMASEEYIYKLWKVE